MLFFLHNFHLLFFAMKLYKVTWITSCNRQTPSDQKIYIDACVSFSKRLQSQILYIRFSCKTPQYEGKLHTLYLFGEKTSTENGNQGDDYILKRNVLLNRIKETLSLNALRVTDPVIMCDIR